MRSASPIAILDLACGKGGDLAKWGKHPAGVRGYVGVDIAKQSLHDLSERLCDPKPPGGNHGWAPCVHVRLVEAALGERAVVVVPPAPADLAAAASASAVAAAPFAVWEWHATQPLGGGGGGARREAIGQGGRAAGWSEWPGAPQRLPLADLAGTFDVVSIQFALHYMWQSRTAAHTFFSDVSTALRVGGELVATTVDTRVIVDLLSRDAQPVTAAARPVAAAPVAAAPVAAAGLAARPTAARRHAPAIERRHGRGAVAAAAASSSASATASHGVAADTVAAAARRWVISVEHRVDDPYNNPYKFPYARDDAGRARLPRRVVDLRHATSVAARASAGAPPLPLEPPVVVPPRRTVCTLTFDNAVRERILSGDGGGGAPVDDGFGLRYMFKLIDDGADSAVDAPEWLVPLALLEKTAAAHGLELVLAQVER